MKQLFYIVSIVLMTTIAFVSCKGTTNKTNPTESGMPDLVGTWHYETVTRRAGSRFRYRSFRLHQ